MLLGAVTAAVSERHHGYGSGYRYGRGRPSGRGARPRARVARTAGEYGPYLSIHTEQGQGRIRVSSLGGVRG